MPEEVHVIPQAHPMHGVGLFTWRNAILGGVMAAALLTTSVAAYLAMWALGIGPVGSLIAQGVIDPNDPVILADFDSGNGSVGIADAAPALATATTTMTATRSQRRRTAWECRSRRGGEGLAAGLPCVPHV